MPESIPTFAIVSQTITIWDYDVATEFYTNGFFGKPLGLRKATPGDKLERPLSLSPFDAVYLVEKRRINVSLEGKILSKDKLIEFVSGGYEDFTIKYEVYKELRELNYVVKPGMKFGTDFIVYEKGPGIDHSKWAVLVEKDDIKLQAINIVRAGRLAHSVKKQFLIAIQSEQSHRYFSFSRFKL